MGRSALAIGMKDTGTNATAIVYYGESDYLTYAPRKRDGTEKKNSVLNGNRFWPHSQTLTKVVSGKNRLELNKLKPATRYYYRILLTNDQGKVWNFETHSFMTK